MRLQILLLDEGSPGHRTQSEGIVDLLQRQGVEVGLEQIRVHNRLPGLLRAPMRRLLGVRWRWLNERLLPLCATLEREPQQVPDLIISSGGKSAFASLVLKRRFGCRSVFVGVPDPFPETWFDLLIPPVQRAFRVPALVTGLIPNRVTPAAVAQAGAEYWRAGLPPSPCWALLIGGNSKSHHFSMADWQGLVDGINTLSQTLGIRWLITTSRRTPAAVEQLLEQAVLPSHRVELVLYNREPKRVMQPFLAAAERVLVSQDSLTMASEALCSGRPVTLLAPELLKVESGSFFAEMIERFPELPGVERTPMAALAAYRPAVTADRQPPVQGLDALGPELVATLERLLAS